MRVLGIDPGTLAMGYGLLEKQSMGPRVIDFGCLKLASNLGFPEKLKRIYAEIGSLITEFKPDQFAIEDIFYARNAKVAIKLGHARGVVIVSAANHGLEPIEYSPREIKQSVVGNGGASKEQVQRMLKQILGLAEMPEPIDASDALAVALCHLHRLGARV